MSQSTPAHSALFDENKKTALEALTLLLERKNWPKARELTRQVIIAIAAMHKDDPGETYLRWLVKLKSILSSPTTFHEMVVISKEITAELAPM